MIDDLPNNLIRCHNVTASESTAREVRRNICVGRGSKPKILRNLGDINCRYTPPLQASAGLCEAPS